jgi:hypothetical protein
VEVPYFLSKYEPDALRFYLTATAPETRDTEACPACPEHGRGKHGRRVLLGGLCRAQQPCPERRREKRVGGHRSAELAPKPGAT